MTKSDSNERHKNAGNESKGHQAPDSVKDDKHPARDNPDEHGEIPRTRDDSKDHKRDPFQDK